MKIELKGVKGFQGHDSYCFTASLYLDGVKRGVVSDDGNGGCIMFSDWNAAKEITEYGKTLPPIPFGFAEGSFQPDADYLVGTALEDHLEQKRLKSLCRKKTVFTLPTTPEGMVEVYNTPFTQDVKAKVLAKHPAAVFLNERIA